MVYGKLTDGVFTPYTGRYVRANGRVYVNPKPETLARLGYKPLIETESEERDGYYAEAVYTETDTEIVQAWEYKEINNETEETE
jgi:hypothetical protein